MSDLTHEEAVEELAGVVLGSAQPNLEERVRAHAQVCQDCRSELVQLETTTRQLSELVPEHPINPGRAAGIRSRLISRASADTDRRPVAVATTTASRVKPPSVQKRSATPVTRTASMEASPTRGMPSGLLGAVAGLAILIAAGALIQMMRANAEAESLRSTIQLQSDTLEPDSKPPVTAAADQDKIVAAVTGLDVRVIPLTHYGARGSVGKMFWNREINTWTLVTYSIRQPKADKIFQVWLLTANGTVSVGTFVPDANGWAVVQGTNTIGRNDLYSISVTEEAKGGAPAPTGPAVIAGAP